MLKSLLFNILVKLSPMKYRTNLWKLKGVRIGTNCEIYNVYFGSEPYLITIGNHVRITNGVRFVTHDGGVWVIRNYKHKEDIDLFGKIQVGNNVHIGLNSIIMPNVTIGDNCIIGCGSIVTKSIPSNSVAVGVPAKVIKSIDDYYQSHLNTFFTTKHLSYKEKKKYLKSLDLKE